MPPLCRNPMFVKPLRLASSEKQITQVVGNIEKGLRQMGLLEPRAALGRQALYPTELAQIHSKRFAPRETSVCWGEFCCAQAKS